MMTNELSPIAKPIVWSGAAASGPIDVAYHRPASVALPATFAGAAITVEADVAGENENAEWLPLYDELGEEVTIVASASRIVALPASLTGLPRLRFVSDATETCTGKMYSLI